jgi:hypothetical protein
MLRSREYCYLLAIVLGCVGSVESSAQIPCEVLDPTGTPLNVRASPNGHIVGTLRNGVQVSVLDRSSDREGKSWVYVGHSEDRSPIGWVYDQFINCRLNDTSTDNNGGTFARRLMGKALGMERLSGCFKRVYDQVHLAQHPLQRVRAMMLLVSTEMVATGAVGSSSRTFELTIGVNFRDRVNHFETGGVCGSLSKTDGIPTEAVHCGVECDGGSIDVALKDDKSVLVSIPDGARLWGPDFTDVHDHGPKFGADDKIFRLDRASLADCLPIVHNEKERAEIVQGR